MLSKRSTLSVRMLRFATANIPRMMIEPRRWDFGKFSLLPAIDTYIHQSVMAFRHSLYNAFEHTVYLPQFPDDIVMNLAILHHDAHHLLQARELSQRRLARLSVRRKRVMWLFNRLLKMDTHWMRFLAMRAIWFLAGKPGIGSKYNTRYVSSKRCLIPLSSLPSSSEVCVSSFFHTRCSIFLIPSYIWHIFEIEIVM